MFGIAVLIWLTLGSALQNLARWIWPNDPAPWEAVDAFYAGGIANGGEDNGAPGIRPEYGQFYYAAFIIDPDGYRLEAFFKKPE